MTGFINAADPGYLRGVLRARIDSEGALGGVNIKPSDRFALIGFATTVNPYEEKLLQYRRLADEHFDTEAYAEFCAGPAAHIDEAAREWFTSDEFDRVLVETVQTTFPS